MLATFSGPGPHTVLLSGAEQYGAKRGAGAPVEGADAFGGVALVAGDGQQVHVEVVDVDVDLADGLGGVGVDYRPDPVGVGCGRNVADGQDRPGFVLRQHHRDQGDVGAQRGGRRGGVDGAGAGRPAGR